jgi:hypothetical protein
MAMKLVKRERVEPKPEPKPVTEPDMKIRGEIRNELMEMFNRERDELRNEFMAMFNREREEWKSKYDVELNQLKDVIHYNTMKILHETASKIDELEMKWNELGCSDKY